MKKRMFIIIMLIASVVICTTARAEEATSEFEFCRALKCETLLQLGDGCYIYVKIKSKKTTWLELQDNKFKVYLYKEVVGPDVMMRKTNAKCIGETSIKWEGLPEGTYYLKFEKAKDGQMLKGTVKYKV